MDKLKLLFGLLTSAFSRFTSTPTSPDGIPYDTGFRDDPRSVEERDKDWLHEERVLPTGTIDPYAFPKITESPYPYMNQNGTMSCVPHAVSLAESIERKADRGSYVTPAPIYVYRQRSNYPQAGTWPPEAFEIIHDTGVPPAYALPTPMTEAGANNVVISQEQKNAAALYKGLSYFTFGTPNEIDAIAHIAAQGHGVPICIYATYKEYAQPYPQVLDPSLTLQGAAIQHEVCVLPYGGFKENGKKYVTIQDSAWFGGFKIRYLSEEFIKTRCYHAGYWDTVAFVGGGPRPTYHFARVLMVGMSGEEVRQMQLLLISEELLPKDCATGLFGGLTLAGVKAFQNKYASEILTPRGLTEPTPVWGQGCIAKANALCGG